MHFHLQIFNLRQWVDIPARSYSNNIEAQEELDKLFKDLYKKQARNNPLRMRTIGCDCTQVKEKTECPSLV